MLLDANILVYSLDPLAPQHGDSYQVMQAAASGILDAVLVPQVLLECYATVTSPRRVLRPLHPQQILAEMRTWRAHIPVLPVKTDALDELQSLLGVAPRRGGDVYDLFLVAQMRSHGEREICTYNTADFRLPGVEASTPAEVLARFRSAG